MQPTSQQVVEPPATTKWLWPSIALGVLGVLALLWSLSSVVAQSAQTVVGNFYTTELAGPGSYEAELVPGTYQLVLFDLNQSDVTVSSGGTAVPLPFRDGAALELRQSRGGTSISATVEGKRVADLSVTDVATYVITLEDNGTVFTNSFDGAQGAISTGGSAFASSGVSDAIGNNAVPLLASAAAILIGLLGAAIAWRAKRRHKLNLAFNERTARNAARQAARGQR